MGRASRKELSELEYQVMQVVWKMGTCTVEQVRLALGSDRQLADSTIRTLLHRLETKGYVSHRAEGRSNVYECRVAPDEAATHTVRRIIERFFHGSAESFLLGLVNERVLSKQELADAAAKLAEPPDSPRRARKTRP
jgi:BlaI family penicillinase repressor